MSRREYEELTNTTIWQNLDFKKVKQRLNQITEQLEEVLPDTSQIEMASSIGPEDYAKLKEFMEANDLTELQAIATIVNAFFSDTPQASNNASTPPR